MDLARELKKLRIMKVTATPVVIRALGKISKRPETRETGNQRKNRDHPEHSTVKIC